MYRIYIDESGTHDCKWLVIGCLFVPDHGSLHSELCKIKTNLNYWNHSTKRPSALYKETHLTKFKSSHDVEVAVQWINKFIASSAFFRCVVIDWDVWDGRFFGDAFESDALKKRRAYKKWLEMMLHPEFTDPINGLPIRMAELYLDRLRIVGGYDVLPELQDRFSRNYTGSQPYVKNYQYLDSWRDAAQCLQLCDLLNGCVYQALVPSDNSHKISTKNALAASLAPFNVKGLNPSFWKGFAQNTLRSHFPKFAVWFWRPDPELSRSRRRMKGSSGA